MSDLWSLVVQHDSTIFDNDDDPFSETEALHSFKFQPVLPIELTDKVSLPGPDQGIRLIARPVFPVFESIPEVEARLGGADVDQELQFGDINIATVLAPSRKEAGGFFYGLGATWGFPTATKGRLGTEKFLVGPSAVAFLFTKSWVFGIFPQQQFSFAGKGSRETVSRLNVQYFLLYQVPNTEWKVGMTPNILVDWEARSGDKVTLPVGMGATKVYKVGRVPVRVLFEAQGFVERPDRATPLVNFRVLIAPVLVKPEWARNPLF